MLELALERADPELSRLIDDLQRTGPVIVTRNGHQIARISRIYEPQLEDKLDGPEIARRFQALRDRVRDHWPDEPQFDWKEAVEWGRR